MLLRISIALAETCVFPFVVALAKKYLPEPEFAPSGRVRVGNDVSDSRGQAGEMRPIDVVGARQISGAERGPQAVRQFGEVPLGDKDITQRLLLLFRER